MKIIKLFLLLYVVAINSLLAQKQPLLSFVANDGVIREVETKDNWSIKRKQILDSLQVAMGELPDIEKLSSLQVQYLDSLDTYYYTRYLISFIPAKDENVTAYLYLPRNKKPQKKYPAMLVLHGTGDSGKALVDGMSIKHNRAEAKELAMRGYVVIAPDYPSMGEQKDYDFHSDRYESGTMKGIFNHIRCIDLLTGLSAVDTSRIGVIGNSLGGHNAMFLGAFDERLKVVVSSSGWTLFDYYDVGDRYGGRLAPWAQDRYMPLLRTKYQLDGHRMPFDFDEVIAAIAPRAFFSNSPIGDSNFDVDGVKVGVENARRVYQFLKADSMIQVRYPKYGHGFPTEVRREFYELLDQLFDYNFVKYKIE